MSLAISPAYTFPVSALTELGCVVYWYMQIKVQVFLLSSSRMPSLLAYPMFLALAAFYSNLITGFYLVELRTIFSIKQHAHAEIVTVTDADLIKIVLVWCRL